LETKYNKIAEVGIKETPAAAIIYKN
jgi:hypothetical protein